MNRRKTSILHILPIDRLKSIVQQSKSFKDIFDYFKLNIHGSLYNILRKRLDENNIDYSHIKFGVGNRKGCKCDHPKQKPLGELLIDNAVINRGNIKKRLIREGILKNECSVCGLEPKWHDKPLTLVLDHINGKNNDYRLKNLRLACPNCNSQFPTSTGKLRRRIANCILCGTPIKKRHKFCLKCKKSEDAKRLLHPTKVTHPPKEYLEELIKTIPMETIGKQFGVTGSSIKKWCKNYGIPLQNRLGYWAKLTKTKAIPEKSIIQNLIDKKYTVKQIRKELCISERLLSRWMRMYGLHHTSHSEKMKIVCRVKNRKLSQPL